LLTVYFAVGTAWFLRTDPDLLKERMTRASNVPRWDRVWLPVYALCLVGLLAAAATDAGRVRWSHVPFSAQSAGGLGILSAFAVIWWCTSANHYLSSQASIQSERGHREV